MVRLTSRSAANEAFRDHNFGLDSIVFLKLAEDFVLTKKTGLIRHPWSKLVLLDCLTDQEDPSLEFDSGTPFQVLERAAFDDIDNVQNKGIFVESSFDQGTKRELLLAKLSRLLPLLRKEVDDPLRSTFLVLHAFSTP